jgi:hypothetical protein
MLTIRSGRRPRGILAAATDSGAGAPTGPSQGAKSYRPFATPQNTCRYMIRPDARAGSSSHRQEQDPLFRGPYPAASRRQTP